MRVKNKQTNKQTNKQQQQKKQTQIKKLSTVKTSSTMVNKKHLHTTSKKQLATVLNVKEHSIRKSMTILKQQQKSAFYGSRKVTIEKCVIENVSAHFNSFHRYSIHKAAVFVKVR